jgi:hypothetical protein
MANEVLINLPPYEERSHVKPASGWGDWPAFTIKQRLISANKQDGDYIVTAFARAVDVRYLCKADRIFNLGDVAKRVLGRNQCGPTR